MLSKISDNHGVSFSSSTILSVSILPKDQNSILEDYTISSLTSTWTTGIISDYAAMSRTVVGDLNHDSVIDIATCSNGFVYLLNYTSPGIYDTVWYSEHVACSKITAADRDADGSLQLFIATSDGKVVIFSGTNHQQKDEFTLPGAASASDIAVANVDGDASLEIVLVKSTVTWVYDASTYALEWTATGFGGNQVAIGDIDNDTQPEIVVNGNPAHILNATTQSQEWALSGGYGIDMSLGDVDGDNFPEIAYTDIANNIYVFDAGTMTEKWHLAGSGTLNDIIVADTNGDNLGEVLVGNHGFGSVFGYQGEDGTLLWTIPNPEYSAYGLAAGDTDGDGEREIIWGSGVGITSEDLLLVGSWVSETVEWTCVDLDGPLYVASGDVDNDGNTEIIVASYSMNTSYDGGVLRVYDGTSHQLVWSTMVGAVFYDVSQLAVGQLDGDAALEIVVGAENWYDTRIKVFDGITHTVDWESPVLGDYKPLALIVTNLDADAVDEIIVGLSTDNVQVFHGLTNIIQWDSGPLDGDIRDLDIGDLDGDGSLDLAIQTNQSVYIYDADTWTQKLHRTITNGWRLTIANADLTEAGELLLVTMDGSLNNTLIGWDGVTYTEILRRPLGVKVIKDLVVNDLDSDGSQELIFMGNKGSYSTHESYLSIADPLYPDYWEYQMDRHWDTIYGIVLIDADNDGQTELLLSSSSVIQINRDHNDDGHHPANLHSYCSKTRTARYLRVRDRQR